MLHGGMGIFLFRVFTPGRKSVFFCQIKSISMSAMSLKPQEKGFKQSNFVCLG